MSRPPASRGVLAVERGRPSRPLASGLADGGAAAMFPRTRTEPGVSTKKAGGASGVAAAPPALSAKPGTGLACAGGLGEPARRAEDGSCSEGGRLTGEDSAPTGAATRGDSARGTEDSDENRITDEASVFVGAVFEGEICRNGDVDRLTGKPCCTADQRLSTMVDDAELPALGALGEL